MKKYYENLDGLRAYAALAVMIFHFDIIIKGWNVLAYGWLGVQVFFVISGFLITNILLDHKPGSSYFTPFYKRRIERILPLYFLGLFLSLLYGIYTHTSISDIGYYLLFVQNWLFDIGNVDFPGIYGHSWTLAIEQQFYLLWPLFIRYLSYNKLIFSCILGIIFTFFWRIYMSDPVTGYVPTYATFSHLDTLLGGSLLAILSHKKYDLEKLLLPHLLIFISLFIAYIFLSYTNGIPFIWDKLIRSNHIEWPYYMLVFSPLCILLVHLILVMKNVGTKYIFENRVMKYIGKISYGVYVYHLFVITLLDFYDPFMLGLQKTVAFMIFYLFEPFTDNLLELGGLSINMAFYIGHLFYILVTIFLAHISYKYFEKRFLIQKKNEVF